MMLLETDETGVSHMDYVDCNNYGNTAQFYCRFLAL